MPEEAELATVEGYNVKVSRAWETLVGDRAPTSTLLVDAAMGVGGPCFQSLVAALKPGSLTTEVRNAPTGAADKAEEEAAKLNNGVGAEHVQKKQAFPENVPQLPGETGARCCSFDGDADRLVYFRAVGDEAKINLFDGDKIACLFTFFIQKQMSKLPEDLTEGITVGCVQTAYANGASTEYITSELKIDAPRAKTGVKYVHHKALEYDIGVMFEPNGHGTVLFSSRFVARLREALPKLDAGTPVHTAVTNLLAAEQLINQATGDAMTDLLAVEAIMRVEGLEMEDWDGFYKDLPSRQLKCKVADRTAIQTNHDESKVLQPEALQVAIDAAVAQHDSGRAFARPSGTEDAVRVYAEAATAEAADKLAMQVLQAIYDNAGGVGERPE